MSQQFAFFCADDFQCQLHSDEVASTPGPVTHSRLPKQSQDPSRPGLILDTPSRFEQSAVIGFKEPKHYDFPRNGETFQ